MKPSLVSIFILGPIFSCPILHAEGWFFAPETRVAVVNGEFLTLRDIEIFSGGPGSVFRSTPENLNDRIRAAAASIVAASLPEADLLESEPRHRKRIEVIRHTLLRELFWHLNVTEKSLVSEEEIQAYYDQNREAYYQMGELASVKFIFFSNEKITEDGNALERARKAHEELREGVDFDEVAERWSDLTVSRNPISYFLHDFGEKTREAILRTPEGNYSTPFDLGVGYQILYVVKAPETRYRTYESLRDSIGGSLEIRKQMEVSQAFLADLDARYSTRLLANVQDLFSATEGVFLLEVEGDLFTKRNFLDFLEDENVGLDLLNTPEKMMLGLENYRNHICLTREVSRSGFSDTPIAIRALHLQRAGYLAPFVIELLKDRDWESIEGERTRERIIEELLNQASFGFVSGENLEVSQ